MKFFDEDHVYSLDDVKLKGVPKLEADNMLEETDDLGVFVVWAPKNKEEEQDG